MSDKQLLNEKSGLKGSRLWGILLFLVLLFVDQVTKILADVYFVEIAPNESIKIIPGMLELCISYNRGIAFGSFSTSSEWVKIAIVVGTALMMVALALIYWKIDKRRSLLRLALVLIIAGGIGNFIDRVYYRVWDPMSAGIIRDGVRDMVRLNILIDFGICNFADFFISVGAVLLVLSLLFFDTDALIPLGKKYRALAKESEEKAQAKKENKEKSNG